MSSLTNKLGIFREDVGFIIVEKLEGRLGDREETKIQPKKGPKKYQPSLSDMNHSQSIFKMEAKVDINSYHGNIDALKLNHWL